MTDGRRQPALPPFAEAPPGAKWPLSPGRSSRVIDRLAGMARDGFQAIDRRLAGHPRVQRAADALRVSLRRARPRGVVPEPPEIAAAARFSTREPDAGPHVLVMSFRNWTTHVAYEYLAGHALRRAGARCSYVVCGGGLPITELGRPRAEYPAPCLECRAYVTRMLDAGGFPYTLIDDLVSFDERVVISRRVREAPDPAEVEVEGIRLAPCVVRSVLWVKRSGLAARTIADTPELQEFVESAAIVATAFARLLDRETPDAIVMVSGLFFAEAVMAELARQRGIRVVSYDFPGQPGTVFLSDTLPASLYDIAARWESDGKRSPTPAEREHVMEVMATRVSGDDRLWQSFDTRSPVPTSDRRGALKLAMFTNVSWDTAVALRDVGFADMHDWLEHVIGYAIDHDDVELDVRVHPGEIRVRGFESNDRVRDFVAEHFPDLPSRIRVFPPDDPVDSYALIEQADAVLVYTSTIGLEAALLGKPVLVAADVHYRGKGFTHDVESRDQLTSLLDARDLVLPAEHHDLAVTYAHQFFFESMLELRSLSERWRGKPVFVATDADALLDDPGIERLCRLALAGYA